MKSFKKSLVVIGFLILLALQLMLSSFVFYFLDVNSQMAASHSDLMAAWESLLRVSQYFKGIVFALGFFVVFSFVFVYWLLSRHFIRPMQQILENASLKEEDFSPIVLKGSYLHYEVERLANAFNSLLERVRLQVEHAREKSKEAAAILESLNEGIIAFDKSAQVTFANRFAYSFLNLPSSLEGSSLLQVGSVDPHFLQISHDLVLHSLQTFEPISHVGAFHFKEMRFLDLIAIPMIHSGGAVLVVQDKTADHKILEMGKNFIANASHELRTPITIIRGFAETLQDAPHLSLQMRKEMVAKIVNTCGRLDNLVKSLLTIADVENGSKAKFRLCDFKMILEHCHHLFSMAHPTAEITLNHPSSPMWISADSDLLDLAVMNILENAVKYSQNTASIEIEIREKEGWLEVDFKDRGIGIPLEDLPHIFDRFYTVNKAHSRKLGGAGLGLSIVKTIVEKHQGKILVDSVLGQGTTFTLKFPSSV